MRKLSLSLAILAMVEAATPPECATMNLSYNSAPLNGLSTSMALGETSIANVSNDEVLSDFADVDQCGALTWSIINADGGDLPDFVTQITG